MLAVAWAVQASSVSAAQQARSSHAAAPPPPAGLPGQRLAGFSIDNGGRTFEEIFWESD